MNEKSNCLECGHPERVHILMGQFCANNGCGCSFFAKGKPKDDQQIIEESMERLNLKDDIELEAMVRDFTAVGKPSKSEVRRRIEEYGKAEREKEKAIMDSIFFNGKTIEEIQKEAENLGHTKGIEDAIEAVSNVALYAGTPSEIEHRSNCLKVLKALKNN